MVAVGAAVLYKLLLAPALDEPSPFLLFLAAVAVAAWRGGLGPGLLAIALSAGAADYLFLEPRYALGPAEAGQTVRLALFAAEALLVVALTLNGRRALRSAHDPAPARAEQDLRDEVKRLRGLLDEGPVAVVRLDEGGAVTLWNARAARLFGWTAEDALGRDLAGLILPASDREPWRAERERFLQAGTGTFAGRRRRRALRRDRSELSIETLTSAERHDGGWEFTVFAEDVTEWARTEQALREQAGFVASLTESMAAAVCALDRQGRVVFLNPAGERLLGWDRSKARGRTLHAVLHGGEDAGHPPEDCPLTAVLRSGAATEDSEDTIQRRDGAPLPVRYAAAPVPPSGEPAGAVVVLHDDSRRGQAERERDALLAREQQARQEAEAESRMKDEFLATVSHELRTPLSAIVGWAHLLRGGQLEPAEQARALETIDRSAKTQAQLIADIFDVSGIITGKLRLTPEPVALGPVVEAAVETVRHAAEAKGVRLETELPGAASRVSGDANRLQQVVWNLLSNAVKFTPAGKTVRVRLAEVDGRGEIVVRDEGKGISPEFLPHAFERFRQSEDRGGARPKGGLGLGLAIVRHLVELHGGTVQAASAGEGQGSTFTVRLPLLAADAETEVQGRAAEVEPAVASEPSLAGVRVLVVDDDPDVRGMMETVLSERGAQVRAAASAGEALQSMEHDRPDVLVSDLAMPEMDGYALMRELRGRPDVPRIPAAAVTAYARAEDRRQALLAGYQMHVAKPIEPSELVAVVASLAGRT